ncbi:MAG: hypothetical protein AAGI48_00470 [Verrucomicrobiota bacterium]
MTSEHQHAPDFPYLDHEFWLETKPTHIGLTILGGLLLFPAGLVFFILWEVTQVSSFLRDGEIILPLGSALIGACSGCFAWIALCLLFFKKTDLRWQRMAWKITSIFGFVTLPCLAGWFLWLLSESAPPPTYLILLFIGAIALASARNGRRFSALARLRMSEANRQPVSGMIHPQPAD